MRGESRAGTQSDNVLLSDWNTQRLMPLFGAIQEAIGAFVENGLFDPTSAEKLRCDVFGAGDAAPQLEMFERFRGRPPNSNAMMSQFNRAE